MRKRDASDGDDKVPISRSVKEVAREDPFVVLGTRIPTPGKYGRERTSRKDALHGHHEQWISEQAAGVPFEGVGGQRPARRVSK